MCKFTEGSWVIDTQKDTSVDILGVLDGDFIEQLYVVESDSTKEIYVQKESNLARYNEIQFLYL